MRIAAALLVGFMATVIADRPAKPQPAPSFSAECGELRHKVNSLDRRDEELTTIEVFGRITYLKDDGVLVYILVCEPPHPRVLCVTYQANGMQPGERVLLAGSLIPRDANHIQLDPCLARYPDR